MSFTAMQEVVAAPRAAAALLPIMGVVFVAFLVIGVAMPVLPLHVHDGLGFVDPRSTGKVIAWVGSAMFAAFAIGAPAGSALYAGYGFAAIAFATVVAPLGTLLLVATLPTVAPVAHTRFSFAKVVGAVWVPGFGSALGS